MKILHTIAGFEAQGGGTTSCTFGLLTGLNTIGCKADLLTPTATEGGQLAGNGAKWRKTFERDFRTPLALTKNGRKTLEDSDYDIYHSNGLWMDINHQTARIARKKDKPYLISPHGMLYPEALHRSYWKKWPLIQLWYNKDINQAACLHATCHAEAEVIRRFGYNGRIEIVPNPIIMPNGIDHIISLSKSKKGRRKIGFLGRIHPRKGIDILIKSLASSRSCKDFVLQIIGDGDEKYIAELTHLAKNLGLTNNVHFAGFVDGEAKYRHLSEITALFVPSDFENFGMIVPEALMMETPVVASKGTPWQELETEKCGWWIERDVDAFAQAINHIAALPEEELSAMGVRGRSLVERKYEATAVARQMAKLYQSIK